MKTVPSVPLISFSWQFKALLHIGYWSTDFIDVLFRVLNVTLFADIPFLAHPRVLRNETVSELIVTTATSVKKCFLLSTNAMYLNERCWFLWAIRISLLARSNNNSHSVFLWVVLLNLTIFWVRKNNVFIFRKQRSVNIKAELFGVKLSTNNSMSDFAWHGPGSFYIYSGRFHMTSRCPYWCSKPLKRRPCWCSKPVLWELNYFLM